MTGEVLEGYLPPKALAMVREWIALHKDTLQEIWKRKSLRKFRHWSKEVSSMFHKVKSVSPLPNYLRLPRFADLLGLLRLLRIYYRT